MEEYRTKLEKLIKSELKISQKEFAKQVEAKKYRSFSWGHQVVRGQIRLSERTAKLVIRVLQEMTGRDDLTIDDVMEKSTTDVKHDQRNTESEHDWHNSSGSIHNPIRDSIQDQAQSLYVQLESDVHKALDHFSGWLLYGLIVACLTLFTFMNSLFPGWWWESSAPTQNQEEPHIILPPVSAPGTFLPPPGTSPPQVSTDEDSYWFRLPIFPTPSSTDGGPCGPLGAGCEALLSVPSPSIEGACGPGGCETSVLADGTSYQSVQVRNPVTGQMPEPSADGTFPEGGMCGSVPCPTPNTDGSVVSLSDFVRSQWQRLTDPPPRPGSP